MTQVLHRLASLPLALLALLAYVAVPVTDAAGKTERYGMEGKILSYDPATDVVKVRVTNAGVSGGFGTGGTAGGKPPSEITSGVELDMQVVPEGSVLKRTVIKAQTGGGLDTTGTKAGFEKALKAIPDDRSVVISFEKSPSGTPAWVIRMVQIRLTEAEVRERLEAISSEE